MRRRRGKIKIKHRVDRRRGGWKEGGEESEEGRSGLEASRVEEGNIKNERKETEKSRDKFANSIFARFAITLGKSEGTDS